MKNFFALAVFVLIGLGSPFIASAAFGTVTPNPYTTGTITATTDNKFWYIYDPSGTYFCRDSGTDMFSSFSVMETDCGHTPSPATGAFIYIDTTNVGSACNVYATCVADGYVVAGSQQCWAVGNTGACAPPVIPLQNWTEQWWKVF